MKLNLSSNISSTMMKGTANNNRSSINISNNRSGSSSRDQENIPELVLFDDEYCYDTKNNDDVDKQCLTWRMNPLESHSDWTIIIEIGTNSNKDGYKTIRRNANNNRCSGSSSSTNWDTTDESNNCTTSMIRQTPSTSRKRRSMDEVTMFHRIASNRELCMDMNTTMMDESTESYYHRRHVTSKNGGTTNNNEHLMKSLLATTDRHRYLHQSKNQQRNKRCSTLYQYQFHVHKSILGVGPYKSQYFEALFMHYSETHVQNIVPNEMSLKETHECTSHLKFHTFDMIEAFAVVLDYIYSHGTVKRFTTTNAVAVKYMASYLDVPYLQLAITDFIIKDDICQDNCLTYLKNAFIHHDEQILNTASDMAAKHLEQLSRTDLLNLSPDHIERIVSSQHLNCVSEELSCIIAEYCRHVSRTLYYNNINRRSSRLSRDYYYRSSSSSYSRPQDDDLFNPSSMRKGHSLSCGELNDEPNIISSSSTMTMLTGRKNEEFNINNDYYNDDDLLNDSGNHHNHNKLTSEWFAKVTDIKIMPRIFPGEGLYFLHLSQRLFPSSSSSAASSRSKEFSSSRMTGGVTSNTSNTTNVAAGIRRRNRGYFNVKPSYHYNFQGYNSSSSEDESVFSKQKLLEESFISFKQRCIDAVSNYWSELLVKDGEEEEDEDYEENHDNAYYMKEDEEKEASAFPSYPWNRNDYTRNGGVLKRRASSSYMMEEDDDDDEEEETSLFIEPSIIHHHNMNGDLFTADDDDDDDDDNRQQKLLSALSPNLQNKVLSAALKAARDELEETANAQAQRLNITVTSRTSPRRRSSAPESVFLGDDSASTSNVNNHSPSSSSGGFRRWSDGDPLHDNDEEHEPNVLLLNPFGSMYNRRSNKDNVTTHNNHHAVGLGRANVQQQQEGYSIDDDDDEEEVDNLNASCHSIHDEVETTKKRLNQLRRISLTRTDDTCSVDEIQRALKNAASKILELES